MKILLADDDQLTLVLLSQYLIDEGHHVVAVYDGWDALSKLESKEQFDFIISDIFMPQVSGIMMGNLVKQFYYSRIPLLLISATDNVAIHRAVAQSGADGFIKKPVSRLQLITTLAKLDRKRTRGGAGN